MEWTRGEYRVSAEKSLAKIHGSLLRSYCGGPPLPKDGLTRERRSR